MIKETDFLKYKMEVDARFSRLQQEIERVKAELSTQELRHKLELQEVLHKKEVEELKEKKVAEMTDEEKTEAEKANAQASVLLSYTEDRETLEKLGFKFGEEK
ncbi:MAG: hypothetical protein IJY05_03155 [Clostridia bacterium]|nr:hypothetical protein [Clostridia bacterium]